MTTDDGTAAIARERAEAQAHEEERLARHGVLLAELEEAARLVRLAELEEAASP
jgi:hypothetical protein